MNQLMSPTKTNSPKQFFDEKTSSTSLERRLIILVPDLYFNLSELSERIWELSLPNYSQVLLVGLCPDPDTELMLKRQLVSLAASIRDNSVDVNIVMETKKSWGKNIVQLWHPGDLVVGLKQKIRGRYNNELREIQQSPLQIAVALLSDLQLESYKKFSHLSKAALWVGAFGIIAGSFLIQIQIDSLPGNWAQSVLLYLSVFAEIGLLWAWNSILG